ncbi:MULTISPECIES: translation elongation factor Ts [Mediterranea]|jgi:elongation factor Ts|uniref:translation elongation factor Ts n=1 Tax=Mediterranea TaxID=1926659 RepID=UPI000334FBF0|nr:MULTISPECIES: translation elongation factor Ts [Mediterranea]MCL1608273.1 translation elongation factor Ts [Mediterranea sp. ET5]MDM8121507.1 translation elongation factor Ts [Mediterranea massiliensis]MDM8198559.1 translation elongation factor Ts [Mediterranea massiliensis]CDD83133.1 elongation factor Ts [Bacteroides sp. CAG:462]
MAVSMADITKLRKMTGAGMMDCKNALTEAEGDFDKAMKIIREKGQAVAAKRSDREASEGCVLAKVADGFGAIIALKCETDFVAKNEDFVKLTNDILDAAIAHKCKTLDEVKALPLGDTTVAQAVTDRSGITGEKMELDGYMTIEAPVIAVYNHQNKNFLCTMVALNKAVEGAERIGHEVAMQVAAMNPLAISEADVPADVLAKEKEIAADKARQEGKPENMIEKIAMGRIGKFYKEVCLLKQEYIQDAKMTVADFLKAADKDLTVTAFKRFTLRAE